MSVKGSKAERDLANILSEWWAPGRSDVFWRVLGSGSRAKSRGRKGLETFGSAGDIMANDPIGAPLLEVFTIENKKGYPTTEANPFEEIDRPKPLKPTKENFPGWIKQVEESSEQAKTPYWMIVFQRPRRLQMACFPDSIIRANRHFTEDERARIRGEVCARITMDVEESIRYLAFAPLAELLQAMTRHMVEKAARRRRNAG